MSGEVNIGTLTATLRGIDSLSPVLRQAQEAARAFSQNSVGDIGKMQASIGQATKDIKALEKQWADTAGIGGAAGAQLRGEIEKDLGAAVIKAQALSAQMKQTKADIADSLKAPSDVSAKAAVEDIGKSAEASSAQLVALGRGLREAGTMMTAAFTVPIVGAAVEAVKFGGDFEAQMTKVVTLAGASTGEVSGLREQLLALGPSVGVGPAELAKGLFVVESAGKTGADAMGVLGVSAKMTALGMGDMDTTTRSLIGSMFAYQSQNLTAAQAGDILAKTVQMGNMRVDELVGGLARVNPVAAAFGIKFQDVAASIATFTHLGGSVDKAVTGIIAVLQTIEKDSPATVKGLAAIGLTAQQVRRDIADNGLTEALIHLIDTAKKSPEGIQSLEKVFGNVRAFVDVMSTAGSQAEQYRRITQNIADSDGTLDVAMKELNKTWGQQWKEMAAQVDVLWIRLSDVLLPIFKEVVAFVRDDVVPALSALVEGFASMPHWVQDVIVIVATFLAALGPGIFVLGSFFQALGNIQKGFALLGAGEALAGEGAIVAFLTNPIVLGAALVIGGIALAIYELNKSLGEMEHHSTAGQILNGLKDGNGNPMISAGAAQSMNLKRSGNPEASGGLENGFTLTLPGFKPATTGLTPGAIAAPESKAAARQRAADLEVLTDATKSYAQVLELVNNDTYEGIKAELARGVSTATAAREYGVGIQVVRDVVAIEKDYEKAQKDVAKAHEEARLALIPLTEAQQAEAVELMKLPVSLHTVAVEIGAADIQVKVFQESLKELAKIRAIESGRPLLGPIVGQELVNVHEQLKAITAELTTIHNIESGGGAASMDKFGPIKGEFLFKPSMHDLDAINASTKEWEKSLTGISKMFGEIGRSIGGPLGTVMGDIGNVAQVGQQALKNGATKTGAGMAMAGAAAGYVAQMIDTGAGASTGALIAHGALQGAAAGSVVPGLGTAIGAGVGALVGWWQSGAEWRKAFSDISRDFGGLHVPEDFAKTIEKIESDTGLMRVQAITTQLDQLIQMAGGLDSSNFDMFFGKLHDAFSYLEPAAVNLGGAFAGLSADTLAAAGIVGQASMTVAEVTQIMDKNFATFAAAGTDAYGRVSDKIKELIDLDQRFGTNSKAVSDWMKGQAANLAGGLADLLTQPMIASAAVIGKAVEDAQAAVDAAKAHASATDVLASAQDALTAALTTQHGEAERNKQALDDLGATALVAFNAAIASGQTFAQALAGIGPQLSTIQKAYKDLGLAIDDAALKGLVLQNTILNGPGGTGKAVSGLQAVVVAATNMGTGIETPEAAAAQQRTLHSVYTQTQAAADAAAKAIGGPDAQGSTIDALIPFQQTLHILDDWAKKNNLTLDDNTRQMIQQSQDLGIWTDDFKTDGEKTRDSIKELITSNYNLAVALGGKALAAATTDAGRATPPGTGTATGPGTAGWREGDADPSAPPLFPMAAGGFGFAAGPAVFSTQGDEEVAFSGEGKRFPRKAGTGSSAGSAPAGGGDTYQITINAVDAASFKQLCDRNPEVIAKAANQSYRFNKGRTQTELTGILELV